MGRVLRKMLRRDEDQSLVEVVHRVALAIGEVKLIERRHQGVVTSRAVANRDALQRARRAYSRAAAAIGQVRVGDGTATGRRPLIEERRVVVEQCAKLDALRVKLAELEALT